MAERAKQCVFSLYDLGEGLNMPSPLLPKNKPDLPLSAALQPHWLEPLETAPGLESLWDEMAPPHAGDERTRGVATLTSPIALCVSRVCRDPTGCRTA